MQEQIRRAQREIGFEYLRFHGLFDEDMHIYSEDEHGKPQFNFAYPAMLFDFILSLGLKPYVELSFLPNRLAREPDQNFRPPFRHFGLRRSGQMELARAGGHPVFH